MKFSAMLGAFVVAAAASALMAESAFAATSYTLNPRDPNAARTCTASGGTVVTDASGAKVCAMPPSCAPSNMPNPYVLDPADPNAAKTCTDSCGTVSTDQMGQKICVRSLGMREPSH